MKIKMKIPHNTLNKNIQTAVEEIDRFGHGEIRIRAETDHCLVEFPPFLAAGVYRILKNYNVDNYFSDCVENKINLPPTSEDALANSPSVEFSYTWIELGDSNLEYGPFYRTEAEAIKNANENYLNFQGNLANKNVIIVQVRQQLGNKKNA